MHLSDHDLRQLDIERLLALTDAQLRAVAETLLLDLKAARERLNQTPANSSRPASIQAPWERGFEKTGLKDAPVADGTEKLEQDSSVANAQTYAHASPAETEVESEADTGNSEQPPAKPNPSAAPKNAQDAALARPESVAPKCSP